MSENDWPAQPTTEDVPAVPNRDLGTGGTKDVDDPPNTDPTETDWPEILPPS